MIRMPTLPSRLPEPALSEALSPRDIVGSGLCIGCGACTSTGTDARMVWDRYAQLKPEGGAFLAGRNEAFAAVCPFSPAARDEDVIAAERYPAARHADPLIGRFEAAYVGHVAQDDFRAAGSSGGMVTWVAAELLRQGLVDGVAHVVPQSPDGAGAYFDYRISRDERSVREGAKSRYHPVHLAEVLKEIRRTPGRYAIVGVPCFIKAVHLLRRQEPLLAERITFTLGLFCGHMKSRRFVESFAWQLGAKPTEVAAVEYRLKDADRPANWYTAHLTLRDGATRQQDWWHLADGDWGAGYFQNSACNYCDDVVAETADISFGDAWVEPYASDGRGTNVVVTRSPVLQRLIAEARADGRLALEEVDGGFIVRTQEAGLRHRREGLAYRLTWRKRGIRPKKRVAPSVALPLRRKLIYRSRAATARWSHRMAWAAARLGRPGVYLRWARAAYAFYEGLTYSRGRLAPLFKRLERNRTA